MKGTGESEGEVGARGVEGLDGFEGLSTFDPFMNGNKKTRATTKLTNSRTASEVPIIQRNDRLRICCFDATDVDFLSFFFLSFVINSAYIMSIIRWICFVSALTSLMSLKFCLIDSLKYGINDS